MRSSTIIALIIAFGGGITMGADKPEIKTEFDVRDVARFTALVPKTAQLKRLGTGMKFVEGPVWMPHDGGFLIFSDIPADELKRWSPGDGLTLFRKPSHNTNGNNHDLLERLISCEHGSRTVTVTEREGDIRTIAETYNGKKLNSPNDLVCRKDGSIWFTDPTYGLEKREKQQPGQFVYRIDPKTSALSAVVEDFVQPNGLCFSPDEKKLYIADSGAPHHIREFDLSEDGKTLSNGKVFCTIDPGVPDGIRCDSAGNIWSSAGDGVHVFAPDGTLLGKVLVPETPANLCFGGSDGKTLFITARTSLYSIDLAIGGATTKPVK
jgi:gluconolactonase